MLKFLVIGLGIFIVYKLFMGDKQKKSSTEAKKTERMAASGEMVKDPVCGTYVPKDADIRVREGEKVHCFCSFECRDKFIKQLTSHETETVPPKKSE